MSASTLVITAIVAVAFLLFLVIKIKIPAFIALLFVSVATGLAAGIGFADIIPLIIEGLGSTLGSVALLVGLGAMLGGIIEKTGGAESLARYFTNRLGETRVAPALMIAAAIISIPIFFDVAFIVLIPIVYSFAKASGLKSPLAYGLPLAFMLFVHVVVPPHPGIAGSASILNADAGLITLIGLALCIPVGIISYFISQRLTSKPVEMLPQTKEMYDNFGSTVADGLRDPVLDEMPNAHHRTPGPGSVLFCVLLPVLLIAIGTIGKIFVTPDSGSAHLLSMIGAPAFALLISCLISIAVLGSRNHWKVDEIAKIMDDALGPAAVVVFVTGAGGVFATVLKKTGIGEAVSSLLLETGMPLIVLAFMLAALLRAAQGSATVSAITTAGLLQGTIESSGFTSLELALINLIIGTGAITLSHINDSGFWVVTRYLGLSVKDGLRIWSPLVSLMGLLGFIFLSIVWVVI